jgi:hypothetical protein
MKSKKYARKVLLAGVIPALLALSVACNLSGAATEAPAAETSPTAAPSGGGEINPTRPPQEQVDPTQVDPTQPAPPAATPTPVPDIPGPGGCTLNGAYVADVTIPDGTEIPPAKPFVKTWRMRNTGTCPWKGGTKLVFVSGDQMGATSAVAVGPVAPGDNTQVSVNMTAPSAPGTYKGNWQLQSPDGTNYGSTVYVEIVVPSAPAPTATPGGSTPPPPTAAPSGPQETTIFIQLDADNSGSGGSSGAGAATAGDDPSDTRVIAYLSWNLSSIPAGAEVVSAKIHWGTQCFRGGDHGDCTGTRNPFPALGNDRLGYLEIRHYSYGDMSNPPAAMLNPSLVSPFQVYSSQPTGTLDVTDQVTDDLSSGDDFQLRITFENATYDGGIGNGIVFVEGTGPNKLEVVYRMP